MGFYIIEINDKYKQVVLLSAEGELYCKDVAGLMPYTEPDLEQIRKEAYEKGRKYGYSKHDTEKIRKRGYDKGLDDIGNALRLLLFQYSNYTLQEIFGYDTARAVVEHFEGSEIVARIRCYEGDVKQDVETIRKEAYDAAYADAEEIYEKGNRVMYQKGLKDAWEAVNKILELNTNARIKIFSCASFRNTIAMFSASEAIEKIRQYEQEQEEELGIKGYFKNGEEVIDANDTKAVILRVSEDNYCQVYTEKGCIENWHIHTYKFHKTGRHFPEIAEVLKKMKESE